ncbi:HlyD family efflux transporter periplasmic adaptor subunit [Heliophilum fasciatum]|uniref:CusB/HlyD membrane fusion family barrel-sandwich protein n=1 Tax=Heliophilum fasciatum TaxID=35700 RepID=A0A4R2RJX8_9FIRM|nr:HlyD family efflux transporter periplasmic adaptor subunit [Heliophilum fasciatum]MCW2279424.1 multidrug resistance efflux pump [Heliophilum fasciatum]TCP59981.1 CusB/HlyD membrane fusion family barrel-sandwich protein [Heliophilum fasciatum]
MKAKKLLILISALYLLTTLAVSAYYGYGYFNYVETDDARVKVDTAIARSPITGRIIEVTTKENAPVAIDEIMAVIEGSSGPNQAKVRIPVTVPLSGTVLRLAVHEREVVTAGQPLAVVADLSSTYVEARLKEKESRFVQVGQTVDIQFDTTESTLYPGIVTELNRNTEQVTWPIISLTPVRQQAIEEQLVIAKIKVPDVQLIPGTSAFVKIKLKEGA